MRKLLALIIFFVPALHSTVNAAPLTVELSDPDVLITIPAMPEMEMAVHPMNEHKPYLRLEGVTDDQKVSIITLAMDGETTPVTCASAIANSILAHNTVKREQVFLGRANEKTFLIIYGLPVEGSVMLNAHIVSATASGVCVEAQVSKLSNSDADVEPWYNGFGESSIVER